MNPEDTDDPYDEYLDKVDKYETDRKLLEWMISRWLNEEISLR